MKTSLNRISRVASFAINKFIDSLLRTLAHCVELNHFRTGHNVPNVRRLIRRQTTSNNDNKIACYNRVFETGG